MQEEQIFANKFSLKFSDTKHEFEYNDLLLSSLNRFNFLMSSVLALFSIIILICLLLLFSSSQKQFTNLNLSYENIKNTNLTSNDFENIMLFFNRFVMVKTKYKGMSIFIEKNKSAGNNSHPDNYNNNSENGRSIENDYYNKPIYLTYNENASEYAYLKHCLTKVLFTSYGLYLSIMYYLLNVLAIIISYVFSKNFSIIKVNFFIIFLFLGMNFHLVSGLLRSYYIIETEILFFIIITQHFIQVLISLKVKINWRIILLASIVRTIYEITLWLAVHYKINQILIVYFLTSVMGSLVSIVISYYNEFSSRTEFFWKSKNKFKGYLFNLLYNIDQGFLSFKNSKITFMNRRMEKILKSNQIKFSNSGNEEVDILIRDYFDKGVGNNKNEQNKKIKIKENNYTKTESNLNENNDPKEKSNSKIDDSKIYFANKLNKESCNQNMLDSLLENFTEINENLHEYLLRDLEAFIIKQTVNWQSFKNNSFVDNNNKLKENLKKSKIGKAKKNITNKFEFNNTNHINSAENNENNVYIKNNKKNDSLKIINNNNNNSNLKLNNNTHNKKLIKEASLEPALASKKLTLSALFKVLRKNQDSIKKDSFIYIGKIISKSLKK